MHLHVWLKVALLPNCTAQLAAQVLQTVSLAAMHLAARVHGLSIDLDNQQHVNGIALQLRQFSRYASACW